MGKQKKRQAEKQSFTVSQNEEELNKKYNLYQDAVQSPKGDISWFLKFFRQYVGGRPPRHLREDFCGTALVCVTWCKGDVFRSAVGLDLDPEPLQWGMRNNAAQLGGSAPRQLCLLQCNVLDDPAAASEIPHPAEPSSSPCSEPDSNPKPALEAEDSSEGLDVRSRPADIVCALNFGVCLLHQRSELLRYFQRVRAALSPEGGIFVADLLGGHAAEAPVKLPRQNAVTGLHYVWEQGTFNPVTRHVNGYISLKCPQTKQVLKHAFSYHWKLWTILDVVELLLQAAFASTHVWVRPLKKWQPLPHQASPCYSACCSSPPVPPLNMPQHGPWATAMPKTPPTSWAASTAKQPPGLQPLRPPPLASHSLRCPCCQA